MFSEISPEGTVRRRALASVAVLLLVAAGCGKRSSNGVQRIAIPPFENLTGDASLDWMSRAAGEVLASQMSASPKFHALVISARRDAPLAGATHVLDGSFSISRGRLRLNAALERLDGNRTEEVLAAEGPLKAGVLSLLDSFARRIEPAARPFGTKNGEALKLYVEGLSSRDSAAFEQAVSEDPDFVAAYTGWAQALLSGNDRAGAQRVLGMAQARVARIPEVDRARLALFDATLRGDPASRVRALRALERLSPADIGVLRSLGSAEIALHRYPAAVACYEKAAAMDPRNASLWNDLGYAAAFARDLAKSKTALHEYQRLAPGDANPLDSLGDVHFYLGRFGEAEQYYLEAFRKSASFLGGATLYKAARARLMTGDVAGADGIFRRFLDSRRAGKDSLADYREAQWQFLAGRRRQAMAQLTAFVREAQGLPDAASQAYTQLSAWSLATGDRQQARAYADQAVKTAISAPGKTLAEMSRFLAEPALPPEGLAARAHQLFANPSDAASRRLVLAYALLLAGHYHLASQLLREVFQETTPTFPNQVNVLLAWALVESGRTSEATDLLGVYWIPQPGGDHPFAFLTFPEVFRLRSVVLENSGHANQARQALEVYRKLSAR